MAKNEQLDFELTFVLSTATGRGGPQNEPKQEIDKEEEHGALLQERCSEGNPS